MRATNTFRDAEALAEFANLDQTNANAVEYFRNNNPDFAPGEWWDYKFGELTWVPVSEDDPEFQGTGGLASIRANEDGSAMLTPTPVWHDAQESIQRAWDNHFHFENVFALTQLLKMVFTAPAEMVLNSDYLHLTDGEMWEFSAARLYGYHQALMYLYEHPNQAKVCANPECRKYFVTAAGKREFCLYPDERGETCSQKQIREQHLEWWNTVGAKRREANQKAKQKKKPKRKK